MAYLSKFLSSVNQIILIFHTYDNKDLERTWIILLARNLSRRNVLCY